ncbi:relaxase/mobilization nuclease domain-containing protein [Rhodoblastus acidophilus]|uniref:relaxase/mobilization nuclease domain-containing protein n=1 Tax=Rhodoblastus acidophilus TaxID=1074 RepID=UPI0030B89ACF
MPDSLARRDLDPADFTLFNIASLDTAVAELRAEARKSHRVKKPVAHLILAFRADESPTRETMGEAVRRFLETLGLSEHKAVAVNHSRFPTVASHYEVHVEVCKIGPDGRTARSLDSWNFAYVERAAATVARELGFSIIPGRFNTLDSAVFGPAIVVRDGILPPAKTQEFRCYAAQTGAMAISEQLNADNSFREELVAARMAADWRALIEVFATRGFSLYINGKTKGRSQRLEAGLLVVDTTNPDRREALSKLSLTSDEKLSGPGLVNGGGKIDGKKFPALGPPPEGLLTVIPPKIRKSPCAKGASSPCAEKAAFEPALSDRFDAAAAFARFEDALQAARKTNSDIATERSKAIGEIKATYAERLDKIITAGRLRRRLVNLVLGRRSEVARFINVTADLIVDHKLEQLRAERSQTFAKINQNAQMRRATVPRWIEFKAQELDRHREDVADRRTNDAVADGAL